MKKTIKTYFFYPTLAATLIMLLIGIINFTWIAFCFCFVAWFVLDFFTGFIHWVLDNYFDDSLDPAIAYSREHHKKPRGMTEWNTPANSERIAVYTFFPVISIITLFFFMPSQLTWLLPIGVLFLGGLFANQFHAWSHEKQSDVPRVVRFLQRFHIILSPKAHLRHHVDFAGGFGVVNGWSAPILDGLKITKGLEFVIEKTTGAKPRRGLR